MARADNVSPSTAQAVFPTRDLDADVRFFADVLGFRLHSIGPADSPRAAVMSGHGVNLRLESDADRPPQVLRIETADKGLSAAANEGLESPGGTIVELVTPTDEVRIPPLEPGLLINRSGTQAGWAAGRAGMQYRDLLPGRLGGAVIASHIRLPRGGPVPDYVHYHRVRFQLIYCLRGRASLVYEEQGPPFTLRAGDCILQPPGIRHRVLECSDGFEVVEVSCPAEHETLIDHDLPLPTPGVNPERRFGAQQFLHHRAADAPWTADPARALETSDTGVFEASGGLVSVVVCRASSGSPPIAWRQDSPFYLGFVLSGTLALRLTGEAAADCPAGSAFAIPAGTLVEIEATTPDLQWLEVAAAL